MKLMIKALICLVILSAMAKAGNEKSPINQDYGPSGDNQHLGVNTDFDLSSISFQSFSLSLSVADIKASSEFYQRLGFKPMQGAGGLEQKWMILKKGETKIGLFQGMFPKNTLTFHPSDARSIYKTLVAQGQEVTFVNGMDQDHGPASFMIIDPDGNPILFDQH
jgi:catechol 2,3-dioxygenase-like lactoylglutathione lyase family enzyme